jgi:hypothetical protein
MVRRRIGYSDRNQEYIWSKWEVLGTSIAEDQIDESLNFWKTLTPKSLVNNEFKVTKGDPFDVTETVTNKYSTGYGIDVSIEISRDLNVLDEIVRTLAVNVFVDCPLYKIKRFQLPIQFSGDFSDQQILNDRDLGNQLFNRFGGKTHAAQI